MSFQPGVIYVMLSWSALYRFNLECFMSFQPVCQVDKCRISVKMMNFRSDYVVFDFQVELKLYFMFSSIRNEVKYLKPYLPY